MKRIVTTLFACSALLAIAPIAHAAGLPWQDIARNGETDQQSGHHIEAAIQAYRALELAEAQLAGKDDPALLPLLENIADALQQTPHGFALSLFSGYADGDGDFADIFRGANSMDTQAMEKLLKNPWAIAPPESPEAAPLLMSDLRTAEFWDKGEGRRRFGTVPAPNYAGAEPYLQRALRLSTRLHGPESAQVARALNKLAWLHHQWSRRARPDSQDGQFVWNDAFTHYKAAAIYMTRALAIREKTLGPEHADVAQSLIDLAVFAAAMGQTGYRSQPDEFEQLGRQYFERAVAIRAKAGGADYPKAADDLRTWATALLEGGYGKPADAAFERALAAREKALGPGRADVASDLFAWARSLLGNKRPKDAEAVFVRALAARKKAQGAGYTGEDEAEALGWWADALSAQGYMREADAMLQRALALVDQRIAPTHPQDFTTLIRLSELHGSLHDYEGQYDYFQRARQRLDRFIVPDFKETLIETESRMYHQFKARQTDLQMRLDLGLHKHKDLSQPPWSPIFDPQNPNKKR